MSTSVYQRCAQIQILHPDGYPARKNGGRVVARTANREGLDLGEALLKAGFARPYTKRRRSRCKPVTPFQS